MNSIFPFKFILLDFIHSFIREFSSAQVSHLLKIYLCKIGLSPHFCVSRNSKLTSKRCHISDRLLLSWILNPQTLVTVICFPHCQSRYEAQVFSQFSKSLTYNNCECGKFYSNKGRDDKRVQAGKFSTAGNFGWILPPPGVSNWSTSGMPFTVFMCSFFSLFVLSQLSSEDQILLHLVQNNLAILFLCTLHACFLIHAFSSHCLPQIAYWDTFLIKDSSFYKIMPF